MENAAAQTAGARGVRRLRVHAVQQDRRLRDRPVAVTHLTPETIALCLSRLAVWSPACRLYATFFEVDEPVDNPAAPHDHAKFRYTRAEMAQLAATAGMRFSYIGEWGHPRGQMMGAFAAR
ncbi:MAG TPA: hypothetical protein VM287_16570 [Egibacteraceae bacterium]|nr:hypothetical protein [Egibacteraceae bacterium]